jgi:hypothetical protein
LRGEGRHEGLFPHRRTHGSAATLGVVLAWQKPFAFVLNQTPIRGLRIDHVSGAIRPYNAHYRKFLEL